MGSNVRPLIAVASILALASSTATFARPPVGSETGHRPGSQKPAAERPPPPKMGSSAIIRGEYDANFRYASVGLLLTAARTKINPEGLTAVCTATLLSCNRVLTAAHCFGDAAKRYFVYFSAGGLQEIDPVRDVEFGPAEADPAAARTDMPNPRSAGDLSATAVPKKIADLAILRLKSAVFGIPAPQIGAAAPHFGEPGTIVGYGVTDAGRRDQGVRREGQIETADCSSGGLGNKKAICWKFADSGSNTCYGDSGGPLFFVPNSSGPMRIIGVTHDGTNAECTTGDLSRDVRLSAYQAWLNTAVRERRQTCRAPEASLVKHSEASSEREIALLTDQQRAASLPNFDVEPATGILRIGINAAYDGPNLSGPPVQDLHVRVFDTLNRERADCVDKIKGFFFVCETRNPEPGKWHIEIELADQVRQLTAAEKIGVQWSAIGFK